MILVYIPSALGIHPWLLQGWASLIWHTSYRIIVGIIYIMHQLSELGVAFSCSYSTKAQALWVLGINALAQLLNTWYHHNVTRMNPLYLTSLSFHTFLCVRGHEEFCWKYNRVDVHSARLLYLWNRNHCNSFAVIIRAQSCQELLHIA